MIEVDARGEIFTIWLLLAMNLVFMLWRMYLRRRQRDKFGGYKPSDYLIIWAFFLILGENIVVTAIDAKELQFRAENPLIPSNIDVISGKPGYPIPDRIDYLKQLYILILINIICLWSVKATLIAFFYEIFPVRLRCILHLCTAVVTASFLANLLETIFWCRPQYRMWSPLPSNSCSLKLDSHYNAAQFSLHLVSTTIVVLLPVLLLSQVDWKRQELTFALSTLAFGVLSLSASSAAYATLGMLIADHINPTLRHATVLASFVDQNAIFLAACLSVVRVSLRRKEIAEDDPSLIIEVRTSWSVDVEIVESWGYHWQDPWQHDNHPSSPAEDHLHLHISLGKASASTTTYSLGKIQTPKSAV